MSEATTVPSAPGAVRETAEPVSLDGGSFHRVVRDQQGHEVDDPTVPSHVELPPPKRAPEPERKTPESVKWARAARKEREIERERRALEDAKLAAQRAYATPEQRQRVAYETAVNEAAAEAHRYVEENADAYPFLSAEHAANAPETVRAMMQVQVDQIRKTGKPVAWSKIAAFLEDNIDQSTRVARSVKVRRAESAAVPTRKASNNPLGQLTGDDRYQRALARLRSKQR